LVSLCPLTYAAILLGGRYVGSYDESNLTFGKAIKRTLFAEWAFLGSRYACIPNTKGYSW